MWHKRNTAFIENITGQEQTTKGDIQHLTPVWPYQEDWQLLCLVEISIKLIWGRRGAALIGKSKEGSQLFGKAFLTTFPDQKTMFVAIREVLLYTAHLRRVVILTNSKEIQLFWRSKTHWPWWIETLLKDIYNIIKQYSILVVFLRTLDTVLAESRKLAYL